MTTASFGDPVTQIAFSIHENKGVFALLLGSGVSRSAEIPTGWEMTLDLVRRVARAEGTDEQTDWGKWYTDREGCEPNYSDLLEKLANTPAERRSILHSYIEPNDDDREEGRKLPTAAHRAIARLVLSGHIRVIVTTNFDRLLENALRDEGIEPTVISSIDSLKGAEPIAHTSCFILKINGDYKDSRILNTEEELESYPEDFNRLLDRIFDEHGLIVCGWSGEWDQGLRNAIERAPNRRYPFFWASLDELEGKAKDLADQRRGIAVPIKDGDAFFTELAEKVQTLEQNRKQNPASIQMLLSQTKKYLSAPEHRIQLSDLIANETHHIIEILESANLEPNGNGLNNEFVERVSVYEDASEGLAKIAGLIGRWGDGESLGYVIDTIRTLVSYANQEKAGVTYFLALRTYPAVLITQACLLGLIKGNNWQSIRQLLLTRMESGNGEEKPVWEFITPLNWDGNIANNWRALFNEEETRVPLSTYLHNSIFGSWANAFLPSISGFTENYILSEMLPAFLKWEGLPEGALEKTLSLPNPTNGVGDYEWAPIGRACWDAANLSRITQAFQNADFLNEVASAGFGGGNPELLKLMLKNYNRFAASQPDW